MFDVALTDDQAKRVEALMGQPYPALLVDDQIDREVVAVQRLKAHFGQGAAHAALADRWARYMSMGKWTYWVRLFHQRPDVLLGAGTTVAQHV